jgi:hypothetical protein
VVNQRLEQFVAQRDITIDRMLLGIRGALHTALKWANAFADECTLALPRLYLGVSSVLKLLTVAAAFDCVSFDEDEPGRVFSAYHSALFEEAKISCASLEQLRDVAKTNWKCICALAAVAHEILSFNANSQFRGGAETTLLDLICPRNVLVSSDVDADGLFVRCEDESADDMIRRLTVRNANVPDDEKTLEDALASYPKRSDFLFSDYEFASPEKIELLFAWNPLMAHRATGFYSLPNQALRPDEASGLMSVCGRDVDFPECISFKGFTKVAQGIGAAPQPPHADDAEGPAFCLPNHAPTHV